MKIIYNNIIPFKGFIALNLFGIVFARKEHGPLSRRTLCHEAIHTAQMRETLYVPFYLWYVAEWLIKLIPYGRRAYANLSLEREAYRHQDDPGYLRTRKTWAWLKMI